MQNQWQVIGHLTSWFSNQGCLVVSWDPHWNYANNATCGYWSLECGWTNQGTEFLISFNFKFKCLHVASGYQMGQYRHRLFHHSTIWHLGNSNSVGLAFSSRIYIFRNSLASRVESDMRTMEICCKEPYTEWKGIGKAFGNEVSELCLCWGYQGQIQIEVYSPKVVWSSVATLRGTEVFSGKMKNTERWKNKVNNGIPTCKIWSQRDAEVRTG